MHVSKPHQAGLTQALLVSQAWLVSLQQAGRKEIGSVHITAIFSGNLKAQRKRTLKALTQLYACCTEAVRDIIASCRLSSKGKVEH